MESFPGSPKDDAKHWAMEHFYTVWAPYGSSLMFSIIYRRSRENFHVFCGFSGKHRQDTSVKNHVTVTFMLNIPLISHICKWIFFAIDRIYGIFRWKFMKPLIWILELNFIKALAPKWIKNLTRNAKSRNRVSKKLSAFISSLWVLLPTSCTLNQNGGVFLKGRFMIIFLYFCQGNYSHSKKKSETYLTKAF